MSDAPAQPSLDLYASYLREAREKKGLDVAQASMVSRIAVATIEAAERGEVRLSTSEWQRLAGHYHVKVPDGLCRCCGCCDEWACVGGCEWIEPTLCSSCMAIGSWFRSRLKSLLELIGTHGQCKGCGAQIYWVTTKQGKSTPISNKGISHFADCPNSSDFKRRQLSKRCEVPGE